jgi:hypothetical protein
LQDFRAATVKVGISYVLEFNFREFSNLLDFFELNNARLAFDETPVLLHLVPQSIYLGVEASPR